MLTLFENLCKILKQQMMFGHIQFVFNIHVNSLGFKYSNIILCKILGKEGHEMSYGQISLSMNVL